MQPNAQRKHRLYIDVTFSHAVTRRNAAKGLKLVLDTRLDLDAKPIWAHDNSPYIDKIQVIERERHWSKAARRKFVGLGWDA